MTDRACRPAIQGTSSSAASDLRLRVALIGAGVMGGGMGRRLLDRGHSVQVFDLDSVAADALRAHGAVVAASPAAAAAGQDFVLLSLPNGDAVREAMLGASGALTRLSPGAVIVETSTIEPAAVRGLQCDVEARGGWIIDAAVDRATSRGRAERLSSGITGGHAAASGGLAFFVGGDGEAVSTAAPLLDSLGTFHRVGPLGSGVAVKVMSNAIVAIQTVLLSEMIVTARSSGIDVESMIAVLENGSADSEVLRTQISDFAARGVFPEKRFPLRYMLKDLALAADLQVDAGVEGEMLKAASEVFDRALQAGYGEEYFPAVIKAIARTTEDQDRGA